MNAPVESPQRYAALINNQNDHTIWTGVLSDVMITRFLMGEPGDPYAVPCTWIESTDPLLLSEAPKLPAGQCCAVGDRHDLLMAWMNCIDIFRAHVRPDLLEAAHTLATTGGSLAELSAAVIALCDEAGYPAPE